MRTFQEQKSVIKLLKEKRLIHKIHSRDVRNAVKKKRKT